MKGVKEEEREKERVKYAGLSRDPPSPQTTLMLPNLPAFLGWRHIDSLTVRCTQCLMLYA